MPSAIIGGKRRRGSNPLTVAGDCSLTAGKTCKPAGGSAIGSGDSHLGAGEGGAVLVSYEDRESRVDGIDRGGNGKTPR